MFADPCPVLPGRQQALGPLRHGGPGWACLWILLALLACHLRALGGQDPSPGEGEHGLVIACLLFVVTSWGGLTKGHPEFVFVDTIKDHLFLMCGFFSLTWGGLGLPPAKGFRPWVSRIAIQLCQFILSSFRPEMGS